jgi:peptide/nickel transport system permease protein
VTRKIFAIRGMGALFIDNLQAGDTQVLLAWLMITAVLVVLFNLLADILYGVLDPRIRMK